MRDWKRLGRLGLLLLLLWLSLSVFALADHNTMHNIEQSRSQHELGRMYDQSGDLIRAEEYYRKAVEMWPDNIEARGALQRLLDARNVPAPAPSTWSTWFRWIFGASGSLSPTLQMTGGLLSFGVLLFLFFRFGRESLRLALLRRQGIPLLGMGSFHDPSGMLQGLPHLLATRMTQAGLLFYDEKGAVTPDFAFIGETGLAQARLISKVLEMLSVRQVQRIQVEISQNDGMINAAVSLAESGSGYVRYLSLVSVNPTNYDGPGELAKTVAERIADAILIALSPDPNTRGLLYQRLGDWPAALTELTQATVVAHTRGDCVASYQAHLNLGNLYSFLGMQDKAVEAYSAVENQVQHPQTLALLYAAKACAYQIWRTESRAKERRKFEEAALQSIARALEHKTKSPLTAYTIACYYSLAGQFDYALDWLREAVAGNLAYVAYALSDPDMADLRRHLGGRSLADALGLRL